MVIAIAVLVSMLAVLVVALGVRHRVLARQDPAQADQAGEFGWRPGDDEQWQDPDLVVHRVLADEPVVRDA
ncbi:hypothetical protein BBK82_05125 [Lentzea guizhouensis]|uniref:Uncharacterized protein n=1 Tax=Lentzea guizhouensis TaxID=1586287 RepID=A0A1B2HCV4_9PSEU|nr:hypothetical protein BBK82_05125 [Lentzea guizhouensis]